MSPGPVIELERLTKTFGRRRGVTDLDLAVEPGQVFGFLGPNGAGKSTTIRLIMGLYRPTSGSVRVLGSDATADGPRARRSVGYLPGEVALHPGLTGGDILARYGRIRGGPDDRPDPRLVARLGAELDQPLRTLSKGNRQKIGLLVALMGDPELLVLDEPTSGLDPLLQRELGDILLELTDRGRTVFLSSHDLDEVQRLAHRVAIIRDGRIVAVDTVDGLRASAPRTVELTFRPPDGTRPTDGRRLGEAFGSLPGAVVTSVSGSRVALTLSGPIRPVLELALESDLVDLVARPADLDELFWSFYRSDPEVVADGR